MFPDRGYSLSGLETLETFIGENDSTGISGIKDLALILLIAVSSPETTKSQTFGSIILLLMKCLSSNPTAAIALLLMSCFTLLLAKNI